MSDQIVIYWVGKNNSERIWGYLNYYKYTGSRCVYYTFWGKMNGKIQFSKVFSQHYYTKREKLKKYKRLEENEIERLNSSVKENFTEYLLFEKLKYESYR